MAGVLIIVPSQGDSTNTFLDVAHAIRRQVHHARGSQYRSATIVQTVVDPTSTAVKLKKPDSGKEYVLDGTQHFSRVILISHSGLDGPILAYRDWSVQHHQPLGKEDFSGNLSDEGRRFWSSVGNSLLPEGKIVFLGCNAGTKPFNGTRPYAANVAQLTGRSVYAACSSLALANPGQEAGTLKATEALNGIEDHGRARQMRHFGR